MSFRWQTDDDSHDSEETRDQAAPGRRRQHRLPALLALLIVVSIGLFLAWRNVRQRAEATETRIKDDVLAIHGVAQNAVAAGDRELYHTLLPPQFPDWAQTQQRLMDEGLLFTGSARIYGLLPLPDPPGKPEVVLDPTLSHATVLTQHSFAFSTTASLAESISLRQMHTYSLGATGWQIAPPPPDFWSPEIVVSGPPITLHYPQRDETFALSLLSELERLWPQMCALPGLTCPPDLHITVRLAPEPVALSQVMDPEAPLHGSWNIILPAPSLAGMPLDEHGEELVVRSMAAQALGPLISQLAGYDCCTGGAIVRAIIERQLYHLGLRTWPLTPDHYEALMEEGLAFGDALVLQRRETTTLTPATWRQMLALVEFLEETLPDGSLASNLQMSVRAWLSQSRDPGQFVTQWSEFTYARSRSAQLAAGIDLSPPGTMQLTCYGGDAVSVLQYDFRQEGWKHRLTYSSPDEWNVESVLPLPGEYGFVIKEFRLAAEGRQMARYLWRHSGGATVLFETTPGEDGVPLFASYDGTVPHWRYTLLSPHPPDLRPIIEQDWWQVDLNVCADGECQPQTRLARPRWSPAATGLLLEVIPTSGAHDPHAFSLFRADARAQNARVIDTGYAPVWLDETHYAYLRVSPEATAQELVVATASDDQGLIVASVHAFADQLQNRPDGEWRFQLDRLQENPADPHLMLVQATMHQQDGDNHPDTYLFMLRLDPEMRAVEKIDLLQHNTATLPYRLSPNGRWLALTDFTDWRLFDLHSGQTSSLGQGGPPAWSPDGDWLAQIRSNNVLLHNPDLGYKRSIAQDLADCPFSSLQWH